MYYPGWAMQDDSVRLQHKKHADEAFKKDFKNQIETFVKESDYNRVKFWGKLIPEHNLTDLDLLMYASGYNLPFGGKCILTGDTFTGDYNTD